jgi:transcription initiation factor TFIID TATA-box-binding protein
MISIGTKSERKAFQELEYARRYLIRKRIIADTIPLTPEVRNIVALVRLDEKIGLEDLSEIQGMIYEPEQFPGGILRFSEPFKATLLIFASGKVIVQVS